MIEHIFSRYFLAFSNILSKTKRFYCNQATSKIELVFPAKYKFLLQTFTTIKSSTLFFTIRLSTV